MRGLGVVGGIISIAGGLWLLSLRAVSSNSLIASIANAIGLYCIGRGLFDVSASLLISRKPAGRVETLEELTRQTEIGTGPSTLKPGDKIYYSEGWFVQPVNFSPPLGPFQTREEAETAKRGEPLTPEAPIRPIPTPAPPVPRFRTRDEYEAWKKSQPAKED